MILPKLNNTLEAVELIDYKEATLLHADYENDLLTLNFERDTLRDIPVFYEADKTGSLLHNGSVKNASHAFARGDKVVLRIKDDEPDKVIGFPDKIWNCLKTPARIRLGRDNNHYAQYNKEGEQSHKIEIDLINKRYKKVASSNAHSRINTYINQPDVELSDGYDSVQEHGSTPLFYRNSKIYFNRKLIYTTANTETTNKCFNGTRSNAIGTFKHSSEGWGIFIYQINTFHDWIPKISGRVVSEFYLYTSTGTHKKLCSATTDITGAISPSYGFVATSSYCREATDAKHGSIMLCDIYIARAKNITSNGDTNHINSGNQTELLSVMITQGVDSPIEQQMIQDTNNNTETKAENGVNLHPGLDIYTKR